MRGTAGEVRVGYQMAAQLGRWSLDEDGFVEADTRRREDFWLDQANTVSVWLAVGRKFWVWSSARIVRLEEPLQLQVDGSPEVRD
jgi:hypothetical protein